MIREVLCGDINQHLGGDGTQQLRRRWYRLRLALQVLVHRVQAPGSLFGGKLKSIRKRRKRNELKKQLRVVKRSSDVWQNLDEAGKNTPA